MKLMIVDGNSILNRAFYAIKALSAKDGTPTNALLGFMNIFHKYYSEQKPDSVAVCFDVSKKTFRNEIYEDYKGTRKGMPDELRVQLPLIKEILASLGFKTLGLDGFEADDLIGTLSTACSQKGEPCVIITGDRDSLQLVDENVTVLLPATRMGHTDTTVYTPESVKENMGVYPCQIVDLKALMGDSSDNIPGVAGIGQKTAVDLICRFETLDNLFESFEQSDLKDGVKAKLAVGKDSAYLSKTLATIKRDVPINEDLESLKVSPADNDAAAKLLSRLDLYSVMQKFSVSAQNLTYDQQAPSEQEIIYTAKTSDVEEISALCKDKLVYLVSNEMAYVVCDDKILMTDDLKALFALQAPKYTYDCKLQYLICQKGGFELKNVVFDLKLAAYLCEPTLSDYGFEKLESIFKSVNAKINDDFFVLDKEALHFACKLSKYIERAHSLCEKKEVLSLLTDIEIPLSETLSSMEYVGFKLDREGLSEYGKQLSASLEEKKEQIYELSGEQFNINSPKQLGEILFEKLSLPGKKKTKTGYSTNADVLDALKDKHPIIPLILEYRKIAKLKSTYTDALIQKVSDDGRIHTTFIQTETKTGRLSSVEPNLQNIPVRTELGSRLREFFVAEKGNVLIDADYSQIELRVLAHIANDKTMIESFANGEDIHTATAAKIYGVLKDEVTPLMRTSAKAVNFGIVYGIGAFSLSQDIGTSVYEANRMINDYLNNFSGVREYMKKTVEFASENGYVKTLYNRRRPIPEILSSNKNIKAFGERVSMNTPIQGTAADIIKIAMNNVFSALKHSLPEAKLILQVHDELIIECPENLSEKACEILKNEMSNAAKLKVALEADVNIGKNWLSAKG